ncbi:MAG TPA: hypothetical protein VLA56_01875 [Pseudomonadales bacterium]|nr:hypothetical protein [Pseudomonadales bacterium]
MSSSNATGSVLLAGQQSASTLLHAVLADAVQVFPQALARARLPDRPEAFRATYPEALTRFEAVRAASGERQAIARHLAASLQRGLVLEDEEGIRPLDVALREPAAPLPLQTWSDGGTPGWRPSVVYRGARWEAPRLSELGTELVGRGVVTPAAGAALAWVGEHLLDDGALSLAGRRIVVLGGGAEMAPTRFWVEAGAEVLWLDRVPPPQDWLTSGRMAGRLHWPRDNVDLLARPQEVLATILAFAGGEAVDLGLYAYAPGQARELRLTGTMNALVNALPPALVASVTMLVSPTTPVALAAADREAMDARQAARPAWEAALARLGLLGHGAGRIEVEGAAASRSVVAIQGTSYQAAQYLGKVMMAECWADHGAPEAAAPWPFTVSANTAAITRTRSLDHPVFAAAFGGAGAFGVETFTPRQSRRINGLLALHDWLRPERPTPGAIRVHGGIHTLPYPLEPALRVAAAFGFARAPRLLGGLLRR